MKLNKLIKISLGALIAFPVTFLVGNDLLANNNLEKFDSEQYNETLLACGGGGGGSSPKAKAAKKAKRAKAKISFKKRQLSKMAAAGEDTSQIAAEIAELEALLAK
jgi:6-phosphofructokinase